MLHWLFIIIKYYFSRVLNSVVSYSLVTIPSYSEKYKILEKKQEQKVTLHLYYEQQNKQ